MAIAPYAILKGVAAGTVFETDFLGEAGIAFFGCFEYIVHGCFTRKEHRYEGSVFPEQRGTWKQSR